MSGGQNFAQAPAHALLPFLSFPKSWSVRPCRSTRIVPSFVLRTETVARPLAAEPVATATVATTATAASRARRRDRALMEDLPWVGCVSTGRTPARAQNPLAGGWAWVGLGCGNGGPRGVTAGDAPLNDEGRP